MVSSLPEDAPSLETSSPYSSPSSATVPQSGFSPLVGLGISNCGLESSFDNASGFSTPVSYSVPPDILSPNQLVSTPTFYDSSLKPPGFPNEACLSIYTGHPDVSLSPLSFYDSQPMSASPSYNTNLEIQCSPETVHQMPGYWTPTSSASPLEAIATSATSLTSFEQLSEQIQPCISTGTSNLQINPGILPYSAAIGGNEEALIKQEVPFSQNDPYKFINTLSNAGDSSISKRFTKIRTAAAESTAATEKAFSCFTCGMTFTRRSNCREHEKRHDPNLRKSVKCPDCQKIFGRNADLRRHINNVRTNYPESDMTKAHFV